MNLRKLILTKNDCYKAGRKIKVQGVGGEHADAVRSYVLDGVVPDGGIDWPPGKGLAMQDVINAELLLGQAQLIESNAAIEETAALILLETVGGGL